MKISIVYQAQWKAQKRCLGLHLQEEHRSLKKMIAIIFSQHSICCAVRKQQRVCDLPSCFLTVQQMLICLLTVEQMLIFLSK